MDMSSNMVLCASNAYNKKYYLNEHFAGLPEAIKEELQIMCVLYTEDVGGILELVFDEDGNLEFRTSYEENDFSGFGRSNVCLHTGWMWHKGFI